MKRIIRVIFIFALFPAIGLQAQDFEGAFNLRQCVEIALDNNHRLKQAIYDEQIALNKLKETQANLLPQINASGYMTNNFSIPVVVLDGELLGMPGTPLTIEFGSTYDVGGAVELNQVIFNASLFTSIKMARSAEELSQIKSRYTREDIIYNVGIVFYDILYTDEQISSINVNISTQDSLYEKTVNKVEQEITREIDLNRIKVGITNLEVKKSQLITVREQQLNYLNVLLGLPLNVRFKLDNLSFREVDLPQGNTTDFNATHRTEIALLYKQRELEALNKQTIKNQYIPTLSFVASGGYQYLSNDLKLGRSRDWTDFSMVGIKLSIPLFDGMRKHRQTRQVEYNIRKLDEEITLSGKLWEMEYLNALSQVKNSYSSVLAQKKNMNLAEKIYSQSLLLYKEGLYSITDLLQTETVYLDAQSAYWSEVITYKKAGLELMKAEGILETIINK